MSFNSSKKPMAEIPITPLWDQTFEKARWESEFALRAGDVRWLQNELRMTQNKLNDAYTAARQAATGARHSQTLKLALDSSTNKLQHVHQELFVVQQSLSKESQKAETFKQKAIQLEEENNKLKTELKEKVDAEEFWDEGIRDCERYVAVLTSRLDDAIQGKAENKKWAFQLAAQLDSTHQRLESALREMQELRSALSDVNEEKSIAQDQVVLYSKDVVALKQKYETDVKQLHHEKEIMQQRIISTEMSFTSTKAQLLSEQKDRQNIEANLKDTALDLQGTRADWATARTSERKLQERLQEAEKGSREYANRIAHLISEFEESKQKHKAAELELQTIAHALKETKLGYERVNREKDKMELQNERLQMELIATRSALGDLRGDVEQSNRARRNLVSSLTHSQGYDNISNIEMDDDSNEKHSSGVDRGDIEFLQSPIKSRINGLEHATVDYAVHRLSKKY
jgi:chromosome segregation ATPase